MFVKFKVKNYGYNKEDSIMITRLEDITAFAFGSQGVRLTMKDGSILSLDHTLEEVEDLLRDDLVYLLGE